MACRRSRSHRRADERMSTLQNTMPLRPLRKRVRERESVSTRSQSAFLWYACIDPMPLEAHVVVNLLLLSNRVPPSNYDRQIILDWKQRDKCRVVCLDCERSVGSCRVAFDHRNPNDNLTPNIAYLSLSSLLEPRPAKTTPSGDLFSTIQTKAEPMHCQAGATKISS
jgi:hypothetical protein